MAESSKPESSGGCLGKLLVMFLLVGAVALGIAVYLIARPQDLSDIGGYGPQPEGAPARDMKVVLQNAVDRGYALSLTESEINRWLARELVLSQGGVLGSEVKLERVWVRLDDGHAEVIMERRIRDYTFTLSMFLTVEQTQGDKGVKTEVHLHGGPFHEEMQRPMRGGRFGRLVVPQGFLILVIPAYQKLAGLFAGEIGLVEEMARIRVEKNRLILDPRDPSADASLFPETF
jgi:hypothetical protein